MSALKLFKKILRSYVTSKNDTQVSFTYKSLMELDTGQDILLIPSSVSPFTSLPIQMNLEDKSTEDDEEETIPEEIEEKDVDEEALKPGDEFIFQLPCEIKEKDDDKIEASLTPNSDIFNENLSVDIQIEMLPAVHFPSEAKLPRDAINNTAPFPMVNQIESKDLTFEQKEQPFFKSPEKSEVNDDRQQTNTEDNLDDDHCFSIQLSIDAPAQLALDSPSHPKEAKPVPSGTKPNVDTVKNIFLSEENQATDVKYNVPVSKANEAFYVDENQICILAEQNELKHENMKNYVIENEETSDVIKKVPADKAKNIQQKSVKSTQDYHSIINQNNDNSIDRPDSFTCYQPPTSSSLPKPPAHWTYQAKTTPTTQLTQPAKTVSLPTEEEEEFQPHSEKLTLLTKMLVSMRTIYWITFQLT